jgi:4-aminobutyrate aminotransferase-like enzyme
MRPSPASVAPAWFQFHAGASRPDMVSMGKCLAAGGAAAGALVLSRELTEELRGKSWQTYSTFRGHPIEVAAISAHVRVSHREGYYDRARSLDGVMLERLRRVAAEHPSVRRIDGRGLHWTIELEGPDWRAWQGQEAEPLASRVVAKALEAGALIATSGEQTSLFLAPPLIVSDDELDRIFAALDHGLEHADQQVRG